MNPQDPNLTNVPNTPNPQVPLSESNDVAPPSTTVMNEQAVVQPQVAQAAGPGTQPPNTIGAVPNTQTTPNPVPQQPVITVAPAQSPQPFVSQPSPDMPTQPISSSSAAMSYNNPSSAPKKKLIMIGAAVALIISLVLVGSLVLYPKLTKPSKQDYTNTVTEVDQARSAYNAMLGSTYISPSSTETEAKNALDTLKKDKEKFDKEFADVANTKAVKKDKELKEAFSRVTEKKPKFDSVIEVTAEALEHLYPISRGVSGISSSEPVDQITKVRRQFEMVSSNLKDDNNKQYVQATIQGLKKLESIVPKILAGRADYRKYDSTATTQFYDTLEELSDAFKDWRSNLQKQAEEGDIKDEFNAFIDILEKKAFKS